MQVTFASVAGLIRKPVAPQSQPKSVMSQKPVATPAGDSFVRFSGCCG